MSFTFKFAIDYVKLNTMLDAFLKQHDKELTAMVGSCLTIQKEDEIIPSASVVPTLTTPAPALGIPKDAKGNPMTSNDSQDYDRYFDQKIEKQKADHKVDNRPIIGDDIPEDPFSNMFKAVNVNAKTTRIGDRNLK